MAENMEKRGAEMPREGDTKVVDGVTFRYTKSNYTLRQYYSHSTLEKGPGPGWDFRTELLDDERSMRIYGRTFSSNEVFNPSNLPDIPYYQWIAEGEKE